MVDLLKLINCLDIMNKMYLATGKVYWNWYLNFWKLLETSLGCFLEFKTFLANWQNMKYFRTFNESMSTVNPPKKWTTKLSSAGLVYCHFGREIVSKILELPVEDPITDVVYDKVYENFVEEIDAIDNGINQHDGEPRWFYYLLWLSSN